MSKNNQEEDHELVKYPVDPKAYAIFGEIGSGEESYVYKALSMTTGADLVAIKTDDLDRHIASSGSESKKIFRSHPNILAEHCSFAVKSRLWVVMPYMPGGSIASIVYIGFPDGLYEVAIATVLRPVLAALIHLHRQGYPHRDVKAGNILVDFDGSVKLAGFRTDSHDVAGPSYLKAPEVIQSTSGNGYGIKSDIWSFGVTALELFTGRVPISHEDDTTKKKKKKKKKKKMISKDFKEMVGMCLKQDPAERPTAETLLNHSFFKNSVDISFKHLEDFPGLEDRPKMVSEKDNDNDKKKRIVTGWRFDEEEFELKPEVFSDREKAVRGLSKIKENLERERKILSDALMKAGAEVETMEEFLQRTAEAISPVLAAERQRNSKLQRENEVLRMEISYR